MEPIGNLQLVASNLLKAGKRRVKRLKARHLSQIAQAEIVRLFAAHQSYDDVADKMDMPGLTGRTVSEVLHLAQLRKSPVAASLPFMARRVA